MIEPLVGQLWRSSETREKWIIDRIDGDWVTLKRGSNGQRETSVQRSRLAADWDCDSGEVQHFAKAGLSRLTGGGWGIACACGAYFVVQLDSTEAEVMAAFESEHVAPELAGRQMI